jgi:hypothetical protein
MFYLFGEAECLRTQLLLTARNGGVARSDGQLKEYYLDFVTSIGGPELRPPISSGQIEYDGSRIAKLIAKHTDNAAPNDLTVGAFETPLAARQEAMQGIRDAIEHLGAVNPGLRRTFDRVIHTLFFHRSRNSGGGSVSSSPGVIWCSPRRTWSQKDRAEFLVHELTHNLLFLDERRFEHYVDPRLLVEPQYFALSAVLKIPRPLDRAFHSLVVASEVLAFRAENGEPPDPIVHPSTNDILRACRATIDGIRTVLKMRPLVTLRFMEILGRIETQVRVTSSTPDETSAARRA